MRHLMPLLAVGGAMILSAEAATADLGDQLFKLLAEDGTAGDDFGIAIDIDNGVVAVGAFSDNENGSWSGSAYLFDASTGAQIAKLLPSDGAGGDSFGFSIAIDNGVVAVGAHKDDDNGADSGSAYLFDAITGAQIVKILPRDGAESDVFGWSIAIDNGVVAVGARRDNDNGSWSGSAYLFNASTGQQLFKLLPNDGAEDDRFGYSIAIDNGVVAVGARFDDDNGGRSGSAYLFDASTGQQLFKLLPNDGAVGDEFGWSIAIDNGVVAVGAYLDDDYGDFSGSAYLFDAITGQQLFKLLPNDGAEEDVFGWSIAIDNGVVAVGARLDDDNGENSGSAYLFDASTGAQIAKILANDGAAHDYFGNSIAIENGVVAVGAVGDADQGLFSGSAYLFDAVGATATPADLLSCSLTFGSTDNPPCDVANLLDDDDIDQILRSQFGFTAFERNLTEIVIEGNGADATTMTSIHTHDGSDTTNVVAKAKARNYSTNSIDDIAQYGVSFPSDDTSHSTLVNSTDYVDANGDVEVRLRYVAPATFTPLGFVVGLDQVRVWVQ